MAMLTMGLRFAWKLQLVTKDLKKIYAPAAHQEYCMSHWISGLMMVADG